MSAAYKTRYSPEQYLALERKSETKNEYCDGFIYAMSGASREHNLIAVNLASQINLQLRDSLCEAYVGDMRVCVNATGLYTYPDVVAVCGEPQFQDREVDTLLNPALIVEVLSSSTEAYDRGKKFAHYRRLSSLREYVLVAQDWVFVERYTRQGDEWVLTDYRHIEESLILNSIECAVSLRAIYSKVRFPEAEADVAPPGTERLTN